MSGAMSPIQAAVRQAIARSPAGWSEEDKRRAILAAEDLAVLTARKAAGEDVDEELLNTSAQCRAIAARAALSSAQAVHEAIIGAISEVATRALLAAL